MGKSSKLFKGLVAGVRAFKSPSKEKSNKEKSATKAADREQIQRKGNKDKCMWSLGKSSSRNRDAAASLSPSSCDAVEIKVVQVEQQKAREGPFSAEAVPDGKAHGRAGSKHGVQINPQKALSDVELSKREEWAAAKIQVAFRAYLAHRAFRALRALIRLQALARGRLVRKQAATTLRCMQALVRVQAHVRGRRVRCSELGQLVQKHLQTTRQQRKKPAEGWVSSIATVQELQAKAQSKQEAVLKRQRALVYAFSEQLWRNAPKQNSLVIECQPDRSDWGWIWLERWMAARPWENGLNATKEKLVVVNAEPIANDTLHRTQPRRANKHVPMLKEEVDTTATEATESVKLPDVQNTPSSPPPLPRPPPLSPTSSFTYVNEKSQCDSSSFISAVTPTPFILPGRSREGIPTPGSLNEELSGGMENHMDGLQVQVDSPGASSVNLSSSLNGSGIPPVSHVILPVEQSLLQQQSSVPPPPIHVPDAVEEDMSVGSLTPQENQSNLNVDNVLNEAKFNQDSAVYEEHELMDSASDMVQADAFSETTENGRCNSTVSAASKVPDTVARRLSTSGIKHDQGESGSPSVPSYMATTQSSKAKIRSHVSPKQKQDSPKQKPDSPHQKPDSASKRRHSLSGLEGKSSPVMQQRHILHVRASSKGQFASLRDSSVDGSFQVNGESRRHAK